MLTALPIALCLALCLASVSVIPFVESIAATIDVGMVGRVGRATACLNRDIGFSVGDTTRFTECLLQLEFASSASSCLCIALHTLDLLLHFGALRELLLLNEGPKLGFEVHQLLANFRSGGQCVEVDTENLQLRVELCA